MVVALATNLGTALAKLLAAVLTGSSAMWAQTFHAFADSGNEVLLLIAQRRSGHAPDEQHPLGYGRAATSKWFDASVENAENAGDIHLRSVNEVRGYDIQGSDEAIGHVDDFIVDDETWEIQYLVVDTSDWWLGRKVLIAPRWATQVSWEQRNVRVNMNRQQIKNGPEWSPTVAINREYEGRLHKHYGRPAYWDDAARQVHAPAAQ